MVFRRSGGRGQPPGGADAPQGYTDLQITARGGFSVVYRAHDQRFDRTVALKVLTLDGLDERLLRRFHAECMATGRVSAHPHIVTVYDAGTTPGHRPWLSMEYCSGGSLSDRLERDGGLPIAEVLDSGSKLAGALHAAHTAGILHRDVKPQNVLITAYGQPALADFGIAQLTTEGDGLTQTAAFTVVHSAPEILEGAPGTVTSDVYSLASTTFAMLAGQAAYSHEASVGLAPLVTRILRGDVPALERTDLPPGLEDLLRAALSADPAQRPASAAELAAGFAGCAARMARSPTLPGTTDAAQLKDVAQRAQQVATSLAAGGVTDGTSTHAVVAGRGTTPSSAGLPAPGDRPTSLAGGTRAPFAGDVTHRREDVESSLSAPLHPAASVAPSAEPAPTPAARPATAAPSPTDELAGELTPSPYAPRPRPDRAPPARPPLPAPPPRQQPSSPQPSSPPPSSLHPSPATTSWDRRPLVAALVAVVVLGTGVGVLIGATRNPERPQVGQDAALDALAPRSVSLLAEPGRLVVAWAQPAPEVTAEVVIDPEVDVPAFGPDARSVTVPGVQSGSTYCVSVAGSLRQGGDTVLLPVFPPECARIP